MFFWDSEVGKYDVKRSIFTPSTSLGRHNLFFKNNVVIWRFFFKFRTKLERNPFFSDLDTDDESISGSELKKRIKELLRIKGSVQKELMSLEKRR